MHYYLNSEGSPQKYYNCPVPVVAIIIEEGWDDPKCCFYTGDKYWRFDADKTPSLGYPKSIQEGFPGVPSNLDAAFVWGGNGKIYFFKGNKYWKFDPNNKNRPIPPGYPRAISNWDLPNNIDGAIQWSNK